MSSDNEVFATRGTLKRAHLRMKSMRISRYAISTAVGIALLGFVLLPALTSAGRGAAFAAQTSTAPMDDASLLDGYRHVEVASVSDAMEKVTGKRAYMTHHMRPIFPAKFAGFATTVLLKKEENAKNASEKLMKKRKKNIGWSGREGPSNVRSIGEGIR